ncbi:hypothetical protein PC9H_010675 [Pleurotus ostreatus]|uniref:Phosphoglycerate mutase-like protein n=1 Tax=Pleurotus ostreatus TaxID=5322 RepID=A0A8H7DNU9_PLEOS|nr:uncharacterized protein PC9H_010675 [Pleurotus ostreatus]KAF7422519.1 hypothetical protein PC9H_010675 [Pleurotus ostreatus]
MNLLAKTSQAKALGASLADTQFTVIHTSDLKRALMTAEAVQSYQKSDPKPLLVPSTLLREQNYGLASGKPFTKDRLPGLSLEDHFARGVYPIIYNRTEKYPEGESAIDLSRRAVQAVEDILLPYTQQDNPESQVHIAIASHGIFISEVVEALLRMDTESGLQHSPNQYRGLSNTGWVRVRPATEVSAVSRSARPSLKVEVTDFNRNEHLSSVVRQKGGIGSAAHDPMQKDIRTFFGGGLLRKPDNSD